MPKSLNFLLLLLLLLFFYFNKFLLLISQYIIIVLQKIIVSETLNPNSIVGVMLNFLIKKCIQISNFFLNKQLYTKSLYRGDHKLYKETRIIDFGQGNEQEKPHTPRAVNSRSYTNVYGKYNNRKGFWPHQQSICELTPKLKLICERNLNLSQIDIGN